MLNNMVMSHSIAFPMPLVPFPMPPSLSLHLPPLLCPLFHFPRRAPPPSSFIPSSISRTLSLSPVKFHPPLSLTNPWPLSFPSHSSSQRQPLIVPTTLISPAPSLIYFDLTVRSTLSFLWHSLFSFCSI